MPVAQERGVPPHPNPSSPVRQRRLWHERSVPLAHVPHVRHDHDPHHLVEGELGDHPPKVKTLSNIHLLSFPRFTLDTLLHAIQEHKVNHLPIVPPIATVLAKHPDVRLQSVRTDLLRDRLCRLRNTISPQCQRSSVPLLRSAKRFSPNCLQGPKWTGAGNYLHITFTFTFL